MFRTGQLLQPERVIARTHALGAKLLLDVYHSLGVVPVDLAAMNVDFAVGGSYKYLRGGPGACFLYVAPRHLDPRLATLDIGWFAKEAPFSYARPDPPRFAAGGDAWMESTPPILTWYQARSGQVFTLAIGVQRLRAYSLSQQRTSRRAAASAADRCAGRTHRPRRLRRGTPRTMRSHSRADCTNGGSTSTRAVSGCGFVPMSSRPNASWNARPTHCRS